MAITTPNVKYPNTLWDDEKLKGGVVYTKAQNNTDQGTVGQVITVDLSDLSDSHTQSAPLVKDVVTFSNGGKLILKAYMDTYSFGGQNYPCVRVILYGKKPNNAETEIYTANVGSITSGHIILTNKTLVQTYGVRVLFMTKYDGMVEGMDSTEFRIYCLVPAVDPLGDSILTGANVIERASLLFNTQDNDYYNEWVSAAGLAYGVNINYGGLGQHFSSSYYSFTNLDTFNSNNFALPQGSYKEINPDDPSQDQEDPSTTGGGTGNFDKTSDPVDFPTAPTGGALSSGAVKVFLVNSTHLTSLFQRLWNTSIFDPSTWQKVLDNPIDALIQLECVPFTPSTSNSIEIKLGNWESGVSAPVVSQQYITIDCGKYKLEEFWGSALDYNPYTKVSCYLPFIGIKDLDPDECMGATLHIKYIIDILTGDLTAQIKCGMSVLYKFQGNCRAIIPVSQMMNDAIINLIKGGVSVAAGAVGNAAGAIAGAINTAVNTVLSKTQIIRSGDISGSVGLLDDFTPYLIIKRPIQSLARDFKSFKGYPSNITAQLTTLSGYTEVLYVHLTGIDGATDEELVEIERLLKEGVII